ncbi:MAG: MerR family DNA-binding transcriptional regulator [Lachnospiraceae bacterium]|nr:MerR family DNA-binding transcriptional regulator [Lachnospiraceae bacterium]
MFYTVGEIAKKLNIPPSTLRYYDKEGLLPFVERTSSGIRMFSDKDFESLSVIECLKKAGTCAVHETLDPAQIPAPYQSAHQKLHQPPKEN